MSADQSATAVSDYLSILHDLDSMRARSRIDDLRAELGSEQDPVQRVLLQQRLGEAETPSRQPYEDAFVEHAKGWADANSVSWQAFAAEGVASEVLRRAGFAAAAPRRGRRGKVDGRRPRVTLGSVVSTAEALADSGPFTVSVLQERSGASPAVVRNAIKDLMGRGELTTTGVAEGNGSPGRRPALYGRP